MKTEIKVGLVGLGILILLFFGIKFLKGIDIFNKEVSYHVLYKDVSGMHESNYIYLNGMKVGYIKDIKAMAAVTSYVELLNIPKNPFGLISLTFIITALDPNASFAFSMASSFVLPVNLLIVIYAVTIPTD